MGFCFKREYPHTEFPPREEMIVENSTVNMFDGDKKLGYSKGPSIPRENWIVIGKYIEDREITLKNWRGAVKVSFDAELSWETAEHDYFPLDTFLHNTKLRAKNVKRFATSQDENILSDFECHVDYGGYNRNKHYVYEEHEMGERQISHHWEALIGMTCILHDHPLTNRWHYTFKTDQGTVLLN
ncbi:hypothetical protein PCE1_001552 [Barthelona sp. PCE]